MARSEKKGHLFVVSAPSGTGKTTLCRLLQGAFDTLGYSVSHTTRKPRQGEVHGKDYFFVSHEAFEAMIRDHGLLEWAKVHGNYYGTSLSFIRESLDKGMDILLDIDVQGAEQIVKHYPDAVTIFIMPPSMEALEQRLNARATDSKDVIETRIRNARDEIRKKDLYRHVIVNDKLDAATNELFELIRSYL
ncbi:MAG: guanylate kinase [Proteobacteria bacterium]|nr:guanylate kinase [Pseudomonadota bacterium]